MAQDATTVTPPNPTPPTNLANIGATVPNPATFAAAIYGTDLHYPLLTSAPFYDDSIAAAIPNSVTAGANNGNTWNEPSGSRIVFAAKHAAVATGGTSVDSEGLGTEVLVTAPGSRTECPTQMVSCLGNFVGVANPPNLQHASTLSGSAVPTVSAASGASNVSGIGTTLLTVTGTNFNRGSVVNVSGVPQNTQYVSATSLTVINALKKISSGTLPVTVTSNGLLTSSVNWTFT